MSTAHSERGFLSLSGILGLLVLAAVIFLAIRLLPPYITNYQLQDEIETLARTATYSPVSETEVRKDLLSRARSLGIQLDENQVVVRKGVGTVDIAVRYEVPVNLIARRVVLKFEPGAGNRNITYK